MFRCLLRWDDMYRLKVCAFLTWKWFFVNLYPPFFVGYWFRVPSWPQRLSLYAPGWEDCYVWYHSLSVFFRFSYFFSCHTCWFVSFSFSYLLSGGSDTNCVVRMTQLYFEKLGANHLGSVVPLCSPFSYDKPGQRIQNYPGALQDLHYVLNLINERAAGVFFFNCIKLFSLV